MLLIGLVIKFALLVSISSENNKNSLTLINPNNQGDQFIKTTDPNDDDFWDDENDDALKIGD